jgi:hypothetical protein
VADPVGVEALPRRDRDFGEARSPVAAHTVVASVGDDFVDVDVESRVSPAAVRAGMMPPTCTPTYRSSPCDAIDSTEGGSPHGVYRRASVRRNDSTVSALPSRRQAQRRHLRRTRSSVDVHARRGAAVERSNPLGRSVGCDPMQLG